MGTIKTTNIEPIADNGTVTLGSSGDTFTLGSGVVQNNLNYPAFSANILTGSITASVSTATKATFNNELYDTDNAYDISNSRFTVPSGKAGKYHFETSFSSFESTANNDISQWYVFFYKNGSNEIFVTTGGGARVGNPRANMLTATLDLAVGDYIEVYFRANSSSGNIGYDVGQEYNRFSGYRIGS